MNIEQTAALARRAGLHAALADVTRLRVVDLLDIGDATASEIGSRLDVPSNLLAHHLRALEHAGLVSRRRSEGDGRRSYWSLRTDALTPAWPGSRSLAPTRRVLFVCTANTARSHLAAALWRRASRVAAASAGTEPGARINPGATAVAARHGLDLPDVAPTRLADSMREGDLVITVCDRAHEELRPLGWAHWSIPDPVPTATEESFENAYEALSARIDVLAPRLAAVS
jgi:protein-tyrosine-phosphatase